MSTTRLLDEMTDDEMYPLEFSDCELTGEEPAIEEPETFSTCPACASEDLDFGYRYPTSDDDEGGEMYHCRACGSVGDAEECASIGPFPAPAMDWRQAGTLPPRIDGASEIGVERFSRVVA
jgi:hypothetical protein